jgi:aminoglycoside 3-N-acetyltransferase
MGALPARLIERPTARRGEHPLNSFAALGPLADELIDPQRPDDVYAPIRQLIERRGRVLLIGVGLNRMTVLHYAELRSGRRLLVRWARRPDGRVCMVETGSCSEGFPQLGPQLEHLARRTTVGRSHWSAYSAPETIDAAVRCLTANREITRCPDQDCRSCADVIAGGPIGQFMLG